MGLALGLEDESISFLSNHADRLADDKWSKKLEDMLLVSAQDL